MGKHDPNTPRKQNATRAQTKKLSTAIQNAERNLKLPFGSSTNGYVSEVTLCKSLGLSPSTVQKAVKRGAPVLPTPKQGNKYNIGMFANWLVHEQFEHVQQLFDEALPQIDDAAEKQQAERRKAVAQAAQEELKLAKELEQVANLHDIMVNVAAAVSNVRAGLMSLCAKLPGDLAHRTEEEVDDILTKEVTKVLEILSEYDHEYIEPAATTQSDQG